MVSVEDAPRQEEISTAKSEDIGTVPPQPSATTATTTASSTKEEQPYSVQGRSHSHDEIEYRYLTFNTPLPTPTGISDVNSDRVPPPEAPDLRKYVSPFQWPKKQKAIITVISSIATLLASFSAGGHAPAQSQLVPYFNISPIVFNLGITAYTLGFAVAPMITAPFSEINGRRPIIVASGLLFMIARVVAGAAGSTYSTMVGGVLSDIYAAENRNSPMAIYACFALFGTGLGPMVCGIIAYHTSWRWIYYTQAIMSAVVVIPLIFFFRETRGSVLLSRKAKTLNKWYDALEDAGYVGLDLPIGDDGEKRESKRIRWKVKSDEERDTLLTMITISVYRPFHLLFTEPVVFFFSLWAAFSWAVLYMQFGAIPIVFADIYNFNLQQTGAVFTGLCVGSLISPCLSISQDKLARRFGKMSSTPEGRLYFPCIASILMPAGMFWFGWSSFPSTHWIVPAIAVCCITMGIYSIYLAVFNYLADTYHRYASSAIAAQSFCRNVLGGIFPLLARWYWRGVNCSAVGPRFLRAKNSSEK
ncbi:hypothetical protein FQN54_001871 [Arachnomyces sp. PD_36]|nr:hypothetical protein FQN54_001871 [Arachnomyces sp. PD_36]